MASTKNGDARAAPSPSLPGDADLAARLGHEFGNPEILAEALTHQSAVARRGAGASAGAGSYERLEFLGDRVLGLIVADLLLRRYPDESEGELALRLAGLVRREALTAVAREIGLGAHLRLERGESATGLRKNPALLADACEAVIGAVYLDGGFEVARAVVEPLWRSLVESARQPPQDPKTVLQEWAQGRGLALPKYVEVGRRGPDHAPCFTVEVRVQGRAPERGEGRSKRLAEQAAARRALALLADAAEPAPKP